MNSIPGSICALILFTLMSAGAVFKGASEASPAPNNQHEAEIVAVAQTSVSPREQVAINAATSAQLVLTIHYPDAALAAASGQADARRMVRAIMNNSQSARPNVTVWVDIKDVEGTQSSKVVFGVARNDSKSDEIQYKALIPLNNS